MGVLAGGGGVLVAVDVAEGSVTRWVAVAWDGELSGAEGVWLAAAAIVRVTRVAEGVGASVGVAPSFVGDSGSKSTSISPGSGDNKGNVSPDNRGNVPVGTGSLSTTPSS